jgi:hypothetical protein
VLLWRQTGHLPTCSTKTLRARALPAVAFTWGADRAIARTGRRPQRERMNGPDVRAAEQVIAEASRLTRPEAERVAAALAVAEADPTFERCRFAIEVGVRLDCGANVESDMLEAVARITGAIPGPRDEEPWASAWRAAVDAACAHIGGFYAYPELSPPLLAAWSARNQAPGPVDRANRIAMLDP